MSPDIMALVAHQRVLPVLRTASAAEAVKAAFEVTEAGLSVVELTATTPDWAAALREVREGSPATSVGLGTVTDEATARTAVETGAAFLVSPWSSSEVRRVADAAKVVSIEGAFSPREVAASARWGPVKIFPAHSVGPDYVRSMRQLLPKALFVPTGGISLEDVPEWIEAGAVAVGVGSDLFRGDLTRRLADLRARLADLQERTA
jgi:2-dehydro-3-deoxyphosphogluconate aldolase / (4S)-4-hydroxy-2-oxoglutarate aldolase